MIRLYGVFLKPNKYFYTQIQRVYGLGQFRAKLLCDVLGISPRLKIKKLSDDQKTLLKVFLERNYKLGSDLQDKVKKNIKRLSDIWAYRGIRHRNSLPVRGQRTQTNAMTRKRMKKLPASTSKFKGKKGKNWNATKTKTKKK